LLKADGAAEEESEENSLKENPFGGEVDAAEMDEYLEGISDKSERAQAAL